MCTAQVTENLFMSTLSFIIVKLFSLCVRLGSNQQSPILSRTEVGLRIFLHLNVRTARETLIPIQVAFLYYPLPRVHPGRLYHLSTNTFVGEERLELSRFEAPVSHTTIAFATKAIKRYSEDTHPPLLRGYLEYLLCL